MNYNVVVTPARGHLAWATLAAVAMAGLWAVPASAEGKTALYWVDTVSYKGEVSSIVPERVGQTLEERLKSEPSVELLERYNPHKANKSANAAIGEAKKLYNSGIGLMVADDFDGASKAFQESIRLFEENLVALDSYEILHDAQLRLGLAFQKAGYDMDARAALKMYISLDPTVKVKPKDYPAEVVEILNKEKRRSKKRGTGKLSVASTPAGSEVLLDGKPLGKTPLKIDAPAGQHYLVVRGASGAFAKKIKIRGKGKPEEVVAKLGSAHGSAHKAAGPVFFTELTRRVEAAEIDSSMTPYLKEMASVSGAKFVGFVIMRKGGTGYTAKPFLYGVDADELALLEDQTFDGDLANVKMDAFKLSAKIIAAIKDFPQGTVVTDNPFAADEAVAAVAGGHGAAAVVTPPSKGGTGGSATGGSAAGPVVVEGPYKPSLDDDQWYEKWWVWTGVGVIVVGGAVAGGVLLMGQEDASQTNGFSAQVTW